jgi:hypothetical protein
MFSIIKQIFQYRPTRIIGILAIIGILCTVFSFELSSVDTLNLTEGGIIQNVRYFSLDMLVPIFLAAIFGYIAWRLFTLRKKSAGKGAILIAISQLIIIFSIWQIAIFTLKHPELELSTTAPSLQFITENAHQFTTMMIPLGIAALLIIIFSVLGALFLGNGIRQDMDMKKDYFAIFFVIVAYLSFVNIWVTILLIIAYALFELRLRPISNT